MNTTTVAVDLAKTVFQLAVADASWRVIQTHRLTRSQFERWFVNREVGLVIMEACGSAHHWARWRIHGRPYLPQASIDDGEKDKIAAIHPDFERGLASVPDGIRWRAPPSICRAECALSQSGSTRHGPTCLAITS